MNLIKPEFEKAYKKWCADFRWTDKLTDTVGKGLKKLMVVANDTNKIDWDTLTPDSWVLVMNDFDLSATKEYYEHGITNVVLLSTIDTAENDTIRQHVHNYIFNIVYKSPKFLKMLNTNGLPWKAILNLGNYPTAVFSGKKIKWQTELQIKGDPEYMKKHFDGVMANPPYGKIGALITEKLLITLSFDTYINLEPIVDFLKFPNIYNRIKLDETQIVEGFGEGAHVLPSIFTFDKNINNNLTAEDFFVYTTSNKITRKYFMENIMSRKTYNSITFDENTTVKNLDFSRRLIFGIKICSNAANHLDKQGINVGGTSKSTPYKINKQELTLDEYYTKSTSKAFWGVILTFATEAERMNAFNFSYSRNGFRFLNLLAHSMQRDNFHAKEYAALFPKVDWTRAWTVEEILADYGYTEPEIAEVIADLENFKDMERD